MNTSFTSTPGAKWLEIIHRPTLEAFSQAFAPDAWIEASTLPGPLVGTADIRAFFGATKAMYDQIVFVHETISDDRTILEWHGIYGGDTLDGVTILVHDVSGRIASIQLYHRPYDQVVAFARDLARRLPTTRAHGDPKSNDLHSIPSNPEKNIMRKMTTFLTLAASVLALGTGAAMAAPIKNVVLVHGAFADGSGWKAVANILRKDGYSVSIVQPPETSLEDDVAATNRVLDSLDGPAVLVGHSYGGVIITEAGNNEHVQSLVYVAAFQPDVGESLGKLGASMPPSATSIVASKDGFLTLDRTKFAADFAADVPAGETALMAVSQVGLSVKAAGAEVTKPAWKTKPTWAIVATQDRSINPELERKMYTRSHSTTTEIKSSHAVYISQPSAVAAVIEQAAKSVK